MSFLLPALLWWWVPAFVAVLLLHLFQQRPTRLLVPSLVIWRRIASREQEAPARRTLFSWFLVLQLVGVSLAILTAAGPRAARTVRAHRELVLVLDNGTRMDARLAGGKTRLEAARERIAGQLAALAPGDRVTLILTAPAPERAAGPTDRIAEIEQRLDQVEPIHGPGRLDEAVALALDVLDAAAGRLGRGGGGLFTSTALRRRGLSARRGTRPKRA